MGSHHDHARAFPQAPEARTSGSGASGSGALDPRRILNLPDEGYTADQVRYHYKALARQLHPDKRGGGMTQEQATAMLLIGAEANAIAPGKRPLSSMSPTIILDADGNPRLTCGAAGGPRIINATLQCILRVLDSGLSIDEALAARRVHHQWSPDRLLMEPSWPQTVVDQVAMRGHIIAPRGNVAVAQAIERTDDGKLAAATDPRVAGSARGV